MRLLATCLGRQHVLIGALCLLVVSCRSPEERTAISTGSEELHGSALIIAEHLIPIPEDESQAIESPSFQRHFKRLGRIELSDSVILGDISRMQVDSRGRLLILDSSSRDVLLFNPDGSFIMSLSAEECNPGFNWRANDAVFSPTDKILTMHSARLHVLFGADGNCAEVIDLGFAFHRANVFAEDGDVFAFTTEPDRYYIRHFDAESGSIEQFAEQTAMKNFMGRIVAGGMVQDRSGRLYLALPFSSQIHVFEPTGANLGVIGTEPTYFRAADTDLPDGVTGDAMMKAMNEIITTSSLPVGLILLDSDKLLLPIMNNYENLETSDRYQAFHILSTSGQTLTQDPILMPARSVRVGTARDGLIYRVTDSIEDENGDWGNQGLEVYRFVQ